MLRFISVMFAILLLVYIMKKSTIDLLKIAEINLLYSFKGIHPDEVHKQINPEFNSISWIVGHCVVHFHMVLCQTCQDSKLLSEDVSHYYRYGTTKEEIKRTNPPFTFSELVDDYLNISEMGFTYLEDLKNDDFQQVIFPEINETLMTSIQRIALHYLGHVGQIVLLRRALGNPGYSFVGGSIPSERDRMKQEWGSWWSESKRNFGV